MPNWTTYAWIPAAVLAGAANALLPLPYSMPSGEARAVTAFAVLAGAAVAGIPSALTRGALSRRTLALAALAAFALGIATYYGRSSVADACTAVYDGRVVKVIGNEYTDVGRRYKQAHPDAGNSEVLDDAAGNAELAWTPASIGRCRTWISATYYVWAPLLIFALLATTRAAVAGPVLVPRGRPKKSPAAPQTLPPRYDAFVSYRHNDADTRFVLELVSLLENCGYRIALDARDFNANAHFLQEMERCIRQSRFTLAVISSAYLGSGNCEEEAVICKIIDMADRKNRLIPLLIEAVPLPAWLYGIVGIDFTKTDPVIDPVDKLKATLAEGKLD